MSLVSNFVKLSGGRVPEDLQKFNENHDEQGKFSSSGEGGSGSGKNDGVGVTSKLDDPRFMGPIQDHHPLDVPGDTDADHDKRASAEKIKNQKTLEENGWVGDKRTHGYATRDFHNPNFPNHVIERGNNGQWNHYTTDGSGGTGEKGFGGANILARGVENSGLKEHLATFHSK